MSDDEHMEQCHSGCLPEGLGMSQTRLADLGQKLQDASQEAPACCTLGAWKWAKSPGTPSWRPQCVARRVCGVFLEALACHTAGMW